MLNRTLALGLLALCAVIGCATPPMSGTAVVPAGFQTPAKGGGTLADLPFLVGEWEGSGLGGMVEETWSHPSGGSMLGTFRIVSGKETTLYQFLVLEEDEKGVALRFLHFDHGLKAWEKEPLVLRLASFGATEAVFEAENEAQNPARMTYSITTEGKLSLVVASRGRAGIQHDFGVKYSRRKKVN